MSKDYEYCIKRFGFDDYESSVGCSIKGGEDLDYFIGKLDTMRQHFIAGYNSISTQEAHYRNVASSVKQFCKSLSAREMDKVYSTVENYIKELPKLHEERTKPFNWAVNEINATLDNLVGDGCFEVDVDIVKELLETVAATHTDKMTNEEKEKINKYIDKKAKETIQRLADIQKEAEVKREAFERARSRYNSLSSIKRFFLKRSKTMDINTLEHNYDTMSVEEIDSLYVKSKTK